MVSRQSAADPADPPSADSAPAAAGLVIGDFQLLRLLGRGGMAEVWLSEQGSLKRNVALKLLKPELMNDASYVQRFQAEAKAAAGLSHPNIVQIFSIGQSEGRHFIAQEYIQGSTLKSFLQRKGALDVGAALHIMRQVASALQAASERGIVHRDIKPENIMLNKKGDVKVADFGLAQLMGGERLNLTQEGTTMGTPMYMSPEQVNGDKIDHRSDIYSFGVTCYHMLAGSAPFKGETAIAVAMQHLKSPPPDLSKRRSDVPQPLRDMIHRMLAKNPTERQESAQKILVELKKIARSLRDEGHLDSLELQVFNAPDPPRSLATRRPWLVVGSLAVLVAAASAGMGWWQRPLLPASMGSNLQEFDTAKEQFQFALMRVNDEDAFRLVKQRFPNDKVWTPMADEQLTLLYLKDAANPHRQKAIQNQINELRKHSAIANSFATHAAIAEAYMQAHQAKYLLANTTLEANRLSGMIPPENVLGTWRTYLQETLNTIRRYQTSMDGPSRQSSFDAGSRGILAE